MKKNVIINADDYGMDEAVDDAIVHLCRRGIVTATSAMVLAPSWRSASVRLTDLNVDCGLHLDLTSPFAHAHGVGFFLGTLIAHAQTRVLDRRRIREAIERQLDAFETSAKAPPAFVDGHQHVHQLPIIATELLAELKERYGPQADHIGFRICAARQWRGGKAVTISALAAPGLFKRVRDAPHSTNSDFAGVYGFHAKADLACLWNNWLSGLRGDRPLIMCHPAKSGGGAEGDPIRSARIAEFDFLRSDAFRDLCDAQSVQPSRWADKPGTSLPVQVLSPPAGFK